MRKAYPDRIVVQQGLKRGQIDDRIIASSGPDASAVEWSDMDPASIAKVLPRPEVRKRLAAEQTGCTDMLALNTSRAPFDNLELRQAMQYAVDKSAQVTANGGPALNDIATGYLPPSLTGVRRADFIYGRSTTGDVEKAKKLLAEGGKPDGFPATITVSTGDKTRAEALQQSLSRVGVRLQIQTVDPSVYYDTIGDTKHAPDMAISGWCPDYPSGSTFLPFVFDGRTIREKGNQATSPSSATRRWRSAWTRSPRCPTPPGPTRRGSTSTPPSSASPPPYPCCGSASRCWPVTTSPGPSAPGVDRAVRLRRDRSEGPREEPG